MGKVERWRFLMSGMEARLMARLDILAQIEESRRSGAVATGRPQRRKRERPGSE